MTTVTAPHRRGLRSRRTLGLLLIMLALVAMIVLRLAFGMDAALGLLLSLGVLVIGLVLAIRGDRT